MRVIWGAAFAFMLMLPACSHAEKRVSEAIPAAERISFEDMEGWRDDAQGAALSAFRRSCARILKLDPGALLDPKAQNAALYGRAGDWQPACLAAAGAVAGDTVAYLGGRAIGRRRLLQLRFAPLARLVGWAEAGLAARPGTLFLAARYIPLGRFGVNVTAGAVDYPFRRFLPWCIAAGASWAGYTVLVGFAAGKWFEQQPLLGVAVAIIVAFALGWLLDLAIGLVRTRFGRRRHEGK